MPAASGRTAPFRHTRLSARRRGVSTVPTRAAALGSLLQGSGVDIVPRIGEGQQKVAPMSRTSAHVNSVDSRRKKIGRPSKGDRAVVYTRVPDTLLTPIKAIVDSTGENQSDIVASLAVIGLRHQDEFHAGYAELHHIPADLTNGELQLIDEAPDFETVWARVPKAVAEKIKSLAANRKKAHVAGAFVLIGLRHPEEVDSALAELRQNALPPTNQEEFDMAI
jgi:hypothetical protein